MFKRPCRSPAQKSAQFEPREPPKPQSYKHRRSRLLEDALASRPLTALGASHVDEQSMRWATSRPARRLSDMVSSGDDEFPVNKVCFPEDWQDWLHIPVDPGLRERTTWATSWRLCWIDCNRGSSLQWQCYRILKSP